MGIVVVPLGSTVVFSPVCIFVLVFELVTSTVAAMADETAKGNPANAENISGLRNS